MPRLNVNIDHVATIRQARGGTEPDPVTAAMIAELAGASGIVAHLREDRRHAQERDLVVLRETVQSKLNMEMAATSEMVKIALKIKPDMVTIVPEKRKELTTEGGLDVLANFKNIKKTVTNLKNSKMFVSLFIDPEKEQVKKSQEADADMVEIHTGTFANTKNEKLKAKEIMKIEQAVNYALDLGLRISAGHGLNYTNVQEISVIEGIEELNIGHSIISRSVLVGIDRAVRDMIILMGE